MNMMPAIKSVLLTVFMAGAVVGVFEARHLGRELVKARLDYANELMKREAVEKKLNACEAKRYQDGQSVERINKKVDEIVKTITDIRGQVPPATAPAPKRAKSRASHRREDEYIQ